MTLKHPTSCITYLDFLPAIPEELLVDCYSKETSKIGFNDGAYYRWSITKDLENWLADNICSVRSRMGCQTMESYVPPHTDTRNWAINYIINTGGDVTTSFHIEPGSPLVIGADKRRHIDNVQLYESYKLEPHRWHLLNTHVLHCISGITTRREAVTIGLSIKDQNPLDYIIR